MDPTSGQRNHYRPLRRYWFRPEKRFEAGRESHLFHIVPLVQEILVWAITQIGDCEVQAYGVEGAAYILGPFSRKSGS